MSEPKIIAVRITFQHAPMPRLEQDEVPSFTCVNESIQITRDVPVNGDTLDEPRVRCLRCFLLYEVASWTPMTSRDRAAEILRGR